MYAQEDYPPLWAKWTYATKAKALDEIDRLRLDLQDTRCRLLYARSTDTNQENP